MSFESVININLGHSRVVPCGLITPARLLLSFDLSGELMLDAPSTVAISRHYELYRAVSLRVCDRMAETVSHKVDPRCLAKCLLYIPATCSLEQP